MMRFRKTRNQYYQQSSFHVLNADGSFPVSLSGDEGDYSPDLVASQKSCRLGTMKRLGCIVPMRKARCSESEEESSLTRYRSSSFSSATSTDASLVLSEYDPSAFVPCLDDVDPLFVTDEGLLLQTDSTMNLSMHRLGTVEEGNEEETEYSESEHVREFSSSALLLNLDSPTTTSPIEDLNRNFSEQVGGKVPSPSLKISNHPSSVESEDPEAPNDDIEAEFRNRSGEHPFKPKRRSYLRQNSPGDSPVESISDRRSDRSSSCGGSAAGTPTFHPKECEYTPSRSVQTASTHALTPDSSPTGFRWAAPRATLASQLKGSQELSPISPTQPAPSWIAPFKDDKFTFHNLSHKSSRDSSLSRSSPIVKPTSGNIQNLINRFEKKPSSEKEDSTSVSRKLIKGILVDKFNPSRFERRQDRSTQKAAVTSISKWAHVTESAFARKKVHLQEPLEGSFWRSRSNAAYSRVLENHAFVPIVRPSVAGRDEFGDLLTHSFVSESGDCDRKGYWELDLKTGNAVNQSSESEIISTRDKNEGTARSLTGVSDDDWGRFSKYDTSSDILGFRAPGSCEI
ncbi:predicted protein [Phaeodactylum tricornutum CCAP 1055/1]|uniref:Uncharacterized protein n=1 Tax=Phaeodactylum tricornutum (strain CCAP 1055/1) TaxID=556484 RepID=B7FY30_PHATC|nr:predicted protein [Phaeodactylum tricornutum CCAP 1055/1]EEC48654.1 predicted protein [Phaeodactylum tricornutum CCAP 1055/1]|eukprot:XP_002179668.1 predicted protein [Phaeodactylum tricornutum CCAP 1055/1]